MDCPKCDGWTYKSKLIDWKPQGGHRILITWLAICPYCKHEYKIEEEFESTGYEKVE